jgi:hypothetical protein
LDLWLCWELTSYLNFKFCFATKITINTEKYNIVLLLLLLLLLCVWLLTIIIGEKGAVKEFTPKGSSKCSSRIH